MASRLPSVPLLALCAALTLPACSVKKMAVNSLGNALASGTSGFASDEDPELVAAAVLGALKTRERRPAESPPHRGGLLAAAPRGRS